MYADLSKTLKQLLDADTAMLLQVTQWEVAWQLWLQAPIPSRWPRHSLWTL